MDILLQEAEIFRLQQETEQHKEIRVLCETARQRERDFLKAIIASYMGDNVALTKGRCQHKCRLHLVQEADCADLCDRRLMKSPTMSGSNGTRQLPEPNGTAESDSLEEAPSYSSGNHFYVDYQDTEPVNVILSLDDLADPNGQGQQQGHKVRPPGSPEPSAPSKGPDESPEDDDPHQKSQQSYGLTSTVAVEGLLRLRDKEEISYYPYPSCLHLTCVTASGFKATLCFRTYDDPAAYLHENPVSDTTFGKGAMLVCLMTFNDRVLL